MKASPAFTRMCRSVYSDTAVTKIDAFVGATGEIQVAGLLGRLMKMPSLMPAAAARQQRRRHDRRWSPGPSRH